MNKLVNDLTAHNSLPVHSNINQFYYMQKIEELRMLKERLEDQLKRLKFVEQNFDEACYDVFIHWRRDYRWFHRYIQNSRKNLTEKKLKVI